MALQNSDQLDASHLNATQVLGINQFGLSLTQVNFLNYGEHTLRGMQSLIDQRRVKDAKEAFIMLQGMDALQVHAVVAYNLSIRQVFSNHFSEKALDNIRLLQARNRNLTNREAFKLHSSLNQAQLNGIVFYNLSVAQVSQPNFGQHTLNGIEVLLERNTNSTAHDAIHILTGLDRPQVNGIISFDLGREQVETKNFGYSIMNAMKALRENGRARNWHKAFEMVKGLNEIQLKGITEFGLERKEVLSPNFGKHTIDGMQTLRTQAMHRMAFDFSYHDAFKTLRGLSKFQVKGITDYHLKRHEVTHRRFKEIILDAMKALKKFYPHLDNKHLYQTAMQLPEYQVRALTVLEMKPEELGLVEKRRRIIQLDKNISEIVSGLTVDAVSHLIKNEEMDRNQAFKVAKGLNLMQVIGMIDFGLRLKQVQHEHFKNSDGILDELFNIANKVNEDFNLPLSPESKKNVRAIFDFRIAQEAEQKIMKTKSDTEDFLQYASHRDLLGIFDNFQRPVQSRGKKEVSKNLDILTIVSKMKQPQATSAFTVPVSLNEEATTRATSVRAEKSKTVKKDSKQKAAKKIPGL